MENLISDAIPKEDPLPKMDEEYIIENKEEREQEEYKQDTSPRIPSNWIVTKDHLLDQILGDIRKGVSTISQVNNLCKYYDFISKIEPKTIFDVLLDEWWLISMLENLIQFKENDVWDIVPRPKDKTVIGTKWVFRKKLDKNDIIIRNNVDIVAKGYI